MADLLHCRETALFQDKYPAPGHRLATISFDMD